MRSCSTGVCTLTPWHTVDLFAQWRVYAEAYDPGRADELAHALYEQEIEAWQRAEQHHRSGTLDDLMRAAGVEVSGAGHESAMRAYLDAWTPHTHIDPSGSAAAPGTARDGDPGWRAVEHAVAA